jgi:PhoPQ-activated pathogenicity-related protein
LLYLPNEPHSIKHYGNVVRGLRALHEASGGGEPLPRVDWEYRAADDGLTLCIKAEGARALHVWRADSADRDFRDSQWQDVLETRHSSGRFVLEPPAGGYTAVFAEMRFGAALKAFSLSTGLAVLPAANNPPYGTQPLSTADVCSAIESTPLSVPSMAQP